MAPVGKPRRLTFGAPLRLGVTAELLDVIGHPRRMPGIHVIEPNDGLVSTARHAVEQRIKLAPVVVVCPRYDRVGRDVGILQLDDARGLLHGVAVPGVRPQDDARHRLDTGDLLVQGDVGPRYRSATAARAGRSTTPARAGRST